MLENYSTMYQQLADPHVSEFVGGFGRFRHRTEPLTPESLDRSAPNIDALESWAWLDLRAEPWILILPPVNDRRYYAVQLIDLYTFNFAYVGSRATGLGGGRYLIAGPNWNGKKPSGVHKVFRSETDIVLALARTALNGPEDVSKVKTLQAGMELWRLSAFYTKAPAPAAPAISFPPYDRENARSAGFIVYLNFLMQFCQPPDPSEVDLLKRFARIGIGPGLPFDATALAPDLTAAIESGVQDGQAQIAKQSKATVSTNGLFGNRDVLKNDYLKRAAGADKRLYGDSIEEVWAGSHTGDGLKTSAIRFPKGELPQGKFFWSMTLYTLPDQLLYANPLKRYSVGDRIPGLKPDDDKGLTLFVGHKSPGKAKESNWLPAPEGPYSIVVRIYGPNKAEIDGSWKLPPLLPVAPAKKKK